MLKEINHYKREKTVCLGRSYKDGLGIPCQFSLTDNQELCAVDIKRTLLTAELQTIDPLPKKPKKEPRKRLIGMSQEVSLKKYMMIY